MSYHVLHRSDRSYEVRMTCGRVCGGGALRWAENSGKTTELYPGLCVVTN